MKAETKQIVEDELARITKQTYVDNEGLYLDEHSPSFC